ncbi:hypothetical protein C4J98_0638 [Pseudomonas orientalis]|nr:hypothetical protein C4J98_0638 [Pseudomonas orientalis]
MWHSLYGNPLVGGRGYRNFLQERACSQRTQRQRVYPGCTRYP